MKNDFFPKLFEQLLPPSWRRRPETNPDRNDAVLARLPDTDATYRALMDHAHELLESAAIAAVQPTLSASRDFLAGRVQMMAEYIQTIESTRHRARQVLQQIEEQRRKKT